MLIDPPYEEVNEARRVTQALTRALAKWPTGTYALWRPIKDRREDARFLVQSSVLARLEHRRLDLTRDMAQVVGTPLGIRPPGSELGALAGHCG